MDRLTKEILRDVILIAVFWLLVQYGVSWIALTLYFCYYGIAILALYLQNSGKIEPESEMIVALQGYKNQWIEGLLFFIGTSTLMYFLFGIELLAIHLVLYAIIALQVDTFKKRLKLVNALPKEDK